MEIREIRENKKQFLPLLLAADEQEDMIDRYLDRGTLYVLDDGGVKCECVVTDEGGGVLEIKNIATAPEWQGTERRCWTLLPRHIRGGIRSCRSAQGTAR